MHIVNSVDLHVCSNTMLHIVVALW